MVRTYIKKTGQGQWSHKSMEEASNKVLLRQLTIRQAAERYNVPYTSLQRRVTLSKGVVKRRGGQQILDKDTEKKFADRLIHLASRGFGITPKNVRKYAFQYVQSQNINHNFNINSGMAGEDWFHRFMARNPHLSIRKPEGLSKARMNGMKKEKVTEFFKTLQKVIDDNNLRGKPECMYNVDETGIPLNNRPPNIIAEKGSRGVVSMMSVERGENVTVLACMNAAGQYIPPFILFKGVRKRDDFMIGMPSGAEVTMTEKGWVTEVAFKQWIHHFNRYRTQGKVILILDGHATHTSLEVVDLCESLGIELVLMPPHTSHALQPLDVSFFKPLKVYYNQHATAWLHSHPQKVISKVGFGGILKQAWNQAATVGNAAKGFEKTGIYPLNPNAIPDYKFIGDTMDHLDTLEANNPELPSTSAEQDNVEQPSTSKSHIDNTHTENNDEPSSNIVVGNALKEIIPSPMKGPTLNKNPRKLTNPIFHLTSPQNKINLVEKEAKKTKKEIEKNKATPGLKEKRSAPCRDWHCIYCAEKFAHPPTEDWIQCISCEEWCHEKCTGRDGGNGPYTCDLCAPQH